MPLIQHNSLPSIDRIRLEGAQVFSEYDADGALPRIKVGFLNMMPDKALGATERQFLRLVAASKEKNCYVYPFSIDGVERAADAQAHIDQYYISLSEVQKLDIDALIVTGANVAKAELTSEMFWPQLAQTLSWAKQNVPSTICSCLATHAACKIFYQLDRTHLKEKCWGVFEHRVIDDTHLMTQGIDAQTRMCHSRFNDISRASLEQFAVQVLIESEDAGVQLAADKNCNMIYMQGHPEYDDISLLKEYKRELFRFAKGEVADYPGMPKNYFNAYAEQLLFDFKEAMLASDDRANKFLMFPEEDLRAQLDNQWQEAAERIFINWLDTL
jgi:homoserine O-succinyltransferase